MSAADPERQSAGGIHSAGSEPEALPETYETDETVVHAGGEVVSPDDLDSGLTRIIGNALSTAREFGGRAGQFVIRIVERSSKGEEVFGCAFPDSEYVDTRVEGTADDGSRLYRVSTTRGKAVVVGGAALLGVTIVTAAAHRRRRK